MFLGRNLIFSILNRLLIIQHRTTYRNLEKSMNFFVFYRLYFTYWVHFDVYLYRNDRDMVIYENFPLVLVKYQLG